MNPSIVVTSMSRQQVWGHAYRRGYSDGIRGLPSLLNDLPLAGGGDATMITFPARPVTGGADVVEVAE